VIHPIAWFTSQQLYICNKYTGQTDSGLTLKERNVPCEKQSVTPYLHPATTRQQQLHEQCQPSFRLARVTVSSELRELRSHRCRVAGNTVRSHMACDFP